MKKLTKEEWLEDMPELIFKLKREYGFYYSGCFRISKDILEITKNKKHKHKIVVYNHNQRFFFVIYRKNDTVIYFTNEYRDDKNWNRIRYFEKKFSRAYARADRELEDELYKNELSDH